MTDVRTEASHPLSHGFHRLPAQHAMRQLLDAQVAALTGLDAALPALAQVAEAGAQALRGGGRMAYAGAGSSGLMALADCLELAGTFGLPPDRTPMLFAGGAQALLHMRGAVEDDPALARADVDRAGLGTGDLVIVLSASGTTPYALQVARTAQARGALVAGIANTAGSDLLAMADFPVLIDTGPEMIAGSTRMGAATAQKVALNMMSVMVATRLGHVHDGHMVNLVADNAKLVARAVRIVADVAGCDTDAAQAALHATGGAVKPAILVARGHPPETAAQAIADADGHLDPALAQDFQPTRPVRGPITGRRQ